MLTERHENAPGRYSFEPGSNFKRTCLWGQLIPCPQVVFWYKKVDSAYFKQQPGGKVICCLYYAFAFLLVGCMLIFLLRYMFVCSSYVAYLCPIMMALCSTFGFSLSVNNIWVALLVYIF